MTIPVTYNISIGRNKPHNAAQKGCPFCDTSSLTDILEQRGGIIWLKNKYPVFEKTWPTVIIETADHDGEISTYAPEQLHRIIDFGLEKWLALEKNPRFKSVLFFKNYGPGSGGSQHHPHSQIIGLEEYDYRDNLRQENFYGEVFHEDNSCYASISSYPICGMCEINVTLKNTSDTIGFSDSIQKAVRFVLHDFPLPCDSYNLFFYHYNQVHAKIFPRYTASPLYMGYRITHIMDEESRNQMLSVLQSPAYFGE
ncbi:MAG: DUF4931 domain-containing protein [Dialister sp.]|nr:DUF4931 domain-containing protein [Dialister sp.]